MDANATRAGTTSPETESHRGSYHGVIHVESRHEVTPAQRQLPGVVADPGERTDMAERTCVVEGCDKSPRSGISDLCDMHYKRVWRTGNVDARQRVVQPCSVDDCPEMARSLGLCEKHYYRKRRTGTTDPRPVGHIASNGYRVVGGIYEHRAVLRAAIGGGVHPCHWCGRSVSWDLRYPETIDALVVDHLDANKLNNDVSNLVPACNPCNSRRRGA